MNVGILIFPDVEVLDFSGPFEVFSVATRVAKRDRGPQAAPFEAFLVAETPGLVRARYGFQVKPHYCFDDHPRIDHLLVPGGIVDQPRGSPRTLDWIRRTAATAELVTSVRTGAFLLAEAGLLDGLRATTHWEDAADLRREFPAVDVVDDQFWVDRGRVVTSAGIAAGIDMCLHLVARLQDEDLARTAARQMVYDWRPGPAGVVAGELEQAQATGGVDHEAAVQRRGVPRAGPEGSGHDGRAGRRSPARVRSQQHLLADRGR